MRRTRGRTGGKPGGRTGRPRQGKVVREIARAGWLVRVRDDGENRGPAEEGGRQTAVQDRRQGIAVRHGCTRRRTTRHGGGQAGASRPGAAYIGQAGAEKADPALAVRGRGQAVAADGARLGGGRTRCRQGRPARFFRPRPYAAEVGGGRVRRRCRASARPRRYAAEVAWRDQDRGGGQATAVGGGRPGGGRTKRKQGRSARFPRPWLHGAELRRPPHAAEVRRRPYTAAVRGGGVGRRPVRGRGGPDAMRGFPGRGRTWWRSDGGRPQRLTAARCRVLSQPRPYTAEVSPARRRCGGRRLKWHTAIKEEAGQPEMVFREEEVTRLPEVVPGKEKAACPIGTGEGGGKRRRRTARQRRGAEGLPWSCACCSLQSH